MWSEKIQKMQAFSNRLAKEVATHFGRGWGGGENNNQVLGEFPNKSLVRQDQQHLA